MGWLEDVLASLQAGGAPASFTPAASPFPDMPAPVDEAAMAAAAREAAGQRMIRANQRRPEPFGGVPDVGSAGIQFALGNSPAGTGVPGPLGEPPITDAERAMMPGATGAMRAGPPDGTPFGGVPDLSQIAPFSIGLPPSMQAAKAMTAPPPAPPPQAGPVPNLMQGGDVPGMPAGPGPMAAPPGVPTDASAARRMPPPAPMGPVAMPEAPQKPFAERLAALGPGLTAMGAILAGEGSGPAVRLSERRAARAEAEANQNMTARALLARGAPAAEVMAAIKSPEMLKAMIGKYFETKQAQNVGGRLVRERPDGSVEVLADFSEEKDKAPTQREMKLPDGSVQRQEYVKGRGWQNVGAPAPGERDRRLSVTDITKLSEEGGKLTQIRGFQEGFKPEYAGWKVTAIGDMMNTAGRNLPESMVGKDRAAAAGWWQDYDRYKNMVRHELFGSALTKTEQDAFLRADITPGMTPEQVERNLATQRRVVEGAMRRKGKGLIGSTYDKGAIASAYGVDPEFFDRSDDPAPTPGRGGTIQIGGKSVPWSLK